MYSSELVQTIADFLESVGIEVRPASLPATTFLPGIEVQDGVLLVDEARLAYPGDLLHEAGHLALMTAEQRAGASAEVEHEDAQAWEVAVIAWSYAAVLHLKIDPREVLHGGGYRGRSETLLRMFAMGVYPGVGTLAALGLTRMEIGEEPRYPTMIRWVRA